MTRDCLAFLGSLFLPSSPLKISSTKHPTPFSSIHGDYTTASLHLVCVTRLAIGFSLRTSFAIHRPTSLPVLNNARCNQMACFQESTSPAPPAGRRPKMSFDRLPTEIQLQVFGEVKHVHGILNTFPTSIWPAPLSCG